MEQDIMIIMSVSHVHGVSAVFYSDSFCCIPEEALMPQNITFNLDTGMIGEEQLSDLVEGGCLGSYVAMRIMGECNAQHGPARLISNIV